MHPRWFQSLWYFLCKPCSYLASRLTLSPNRLKWASTWLCHLGVTSDVPKAISEPMVHSAQTVHLSCSEIKTISKHTKTRFHLTHITLQYHRVCPKWFPCPLYIRRKPCTYLAPRLTQSPNGPKWASIWPTSPSSTIGCVQNDFRAYGTFGANYAPILRRD
jgi:hypothetical protein